MQILEVKADFVLTIERVGGQENRLMLTVVFGNVLEGCQLSVDKPAIKLLNKKNKVFLCQLRVVICLQLEESIQNNDYVEGYQI